MALLINKIFSSRKKTYNKHQDACERSFTFSHDQVRIVLFRECDFRGRKLLFDSQSVQKVLIPATPNKINGSNNVTNTPLKNDNFVEISNGYGYQYTRPHSDICQLSEMVFGSVAMSFRGTSLKIHSFSAPAKLMCTQVFPSPRHPIRGRTSVTSQNYDALRSNNSIQSFEKSLRLDNSSASSTTSFNEQLSLYSTESDNNKFTSGSVPLDVPSSQSMTNPKCAPSLEGDSGFCGEQSYSSMSSGPPSMSLWDTRHEYASVQGFSCGSLYKRWLRSASTSLDYNTCSDNSLSGMHSSVSADECMTRGHRRTSKLGLAVIIRLSDGQEIDLERFLLEHSALIEAMVCRARAGAESAYIKPGSFASLMYAVFKETSQWLVDLITGPMLCAYLWHTLTMPRLKPFAVNSCDKNGANMFKTKSESSLVKRNRTKDNLVLLSSSLLEIDCDSLNGGKSVSNLDIARLFVSNELFFNKFDAKLKNVRANPNLINDASLNSEMFVRELCELLESIDVKQTNFFISTLLTAVLTNHLGWVSTVLPPSQTDKDTLSKLNSPCNPLWGQLSDLYGAVGSPTKVAHTIICGNNKGDIITKILNTLTYFIRCSLVERNYLFRFSSSDENSDADMLSSKNTQLNSEINMRRIDEINCKTSEITKTEELEMSILNLSDKEESKSFGLTRTKSCLGSINQQSELVVNEDKVGVSEHPLLEKVQSLGLGAATDTLDLDNFTNDVQNLIDIREASDQIRKVFQPKLRTDISYSSLSKLVESDKKTDVVFVLGDNERLVGIKKDQSNNNDVENHANLNIPSCSNQRPNDLKIPARKSLFRCDSDDSPDTCLHLSSSSETSPCSECEKNNRDLKSSLVGFHSTLNPDEGQSKIVMTHSSVINLESEPNNLEIRRTEYNRSQSVPPSDKSQRKCSKNGCKKKYSGVKFDFKQYPQIVTKYMKSKNLEMSQIAFSEKSFKLSRSFSCSFNDCSKIDVPTCDCEPHSEETLQTPSNASELEFTSELVHEKVEKPKAKERRLKTPLKTIGNCSKDKFEHPLQENNAIFEHEIDTYEKTTTSNIHRMNCIELPMPRTVTEQSESSYVGYTKTLLRGVSDSYVSDLVLQGITAPQSIWESTLKRDLTLAARNPLLDQPIQEAVAIVANTDTWEVQLISSHTYVVEKSSLGIRVGMSQLIADMLESLLHMWRLKTPPEYCLMHIESRLRECCIRSKALAQLLMATEFCNMDYLTSTLQLEVNDVPLLMAVASTHTPQVTQKYGLSFQ